MQSLIPSSAKRSFLTIATLGSLLASPIAQASTTIVDWAAQSASAYVPFAGPTENEGGGTYRRYSTSTPMAETAGVKFYGASALEYTSGTTTPAYNNNLFGIRANGEIALSADAVDAPITMRTLLFVKKEDFLNGAADTVVTFDEHSQLTIKVTSNQGSTKQVRSAVYALVDGEWNWYISASTKGGVAEHVFGNLAEEKWALFPFSDESLSIATPPNSSAFSFTGSAFEDIGAVGIFINYAQVQGKTANIYFSTLKIDAQFAPIPEGSTIGMMLLGGGLLLTGLRFRTK